MVGNKQGNPRVSVIMTAYNDLRFINAAVMSLLRQSYDDFELIIVDDGTGRPEVFSQQAAKSSICHTSRRRLQSGHAAG